MSSAILFSLWRSDFILIRNSPTGSLKLLLESSLFSSHG